MQVGVVVAAYEDDAVSRLVVGRMGGRLSLSYRIHQVAVGWTQRIESRLTGDAANGYSIDTGYTRWSRRICRLEKVEFLLRRTVLPSDYDRGTRLAAPWDHTRRTG
jgi:hypothetical protein